MTTLDLNLLQTPALATARFFLGQLVEPGPFNWQVLAGEVAQPMLVI